MDWGTVSEALFFCKNTDVLIQEYRKIIQLCWRTIDCTAIASKPMDVLALVSGIMQKKKRNNRERHELVYGQLRGTVTVHSNIFFFPLKLTKNISGNFLLSVKICKEHINMCMDKYISSSSLFLLLLAVVPLRLDVG